MLIEELQRLYPHLTDDELSLAAEHLDRYLEIAWEIMQEIDVSDPA
jgi:hypothetical protein